MNWLWFHRFMRFYSLREAIVLLRCWLPQGEGACGEGALDIDETLVAAAAKTQGGVALGLDEGALDQHVELSHDVAQAFITHHLLPGVARVAPDIVAQFLLDAVDEGAGAVGLLKGVAAAEGDRCLIIGYDLHQLVKGALFPTPKIPRSCVVAARATMAAARQID